MECLRDGALLWMDIEGYEGHALRGAPNLLAAGIPVVCEYNTGYLETPGWNELVLCWRGGGFLI